MARQILAYLRSNPGSTCAEIAEDLEIKTAFVRAHLQVLRAEGKIESYGNTRGTRWACT